jgi:hypothetical protein
MAGKKATTLPNITHDAPLEPVVVPTAPAPIVRNDLTKIQQLVEEARTAKPFVPPRDTCRVDNVLLYDGVTINQQGIRALKSKDLQGYEFVLDLRTRVVWAIERVTAAGQIAPDPKMALVPLDNVRSAWLIE